MTAARRIVPMPLRDAIEALGAVAASGATWSGGDGPWTLVLAGPVHEHVAGTGPGDWTWAGAHGSVLGLRALRRPVAVELTVDEWSAGAVELVLRPAGTRLGARFTHAVDALVELVADALLLDAAAVAREGERSVATRRTARATTPVPA